MKGAILSIDHFYILHWIIRSPTFTGRLVGVAVCVLNILTVAIV